MLVFKAGIHAKLVRIVNSEDLDQIASSEAVMIWVCTVTLGTLGCQRVFKILECLPYNNFVLCICLNDAHELQDTFAWVKVFRINPEFRILKLTFHRKSASKC